LRQFAFIADREKLSYTIAFESTETIYSMSGMSHFQEAAEERRQLGNEERQRGVVIHYLDWNRNSDELSLLLDSVTTRNSFLRALTVLWMNRGVRVYDVENMH